MTGFLPFRGGWVALGLLALAMAGLAGLIARDPSPADQPALEAPGCESCDARHAGRSDLRAATGKATE